MASEAVSGPKHYGQKNNKGEDRVNGKEMLVQPSINWFFQNQEDRLLDQYYHQNRGDERLMMSYSLGDFPIRMDGTEFLVNVRFLVAMHHINRFNMIFVRVKWRTLQELTMCAVLRFGSPDADIRLAAQECCSNLEQFVHVQISLYGSVLTKTCIGSSDLNLSIDIPQMDCGDAVETMRQATELLNSTCGGSLDVLDAQFSTDVPMCIKFTLSNVCIRVTWRCESGVKFGRFLSVYTTVSLIYATDRNLGGLASYAFDIMLLYFLQRKGLLPCLHEMRPIISHETDSLPLIDDFYEKRDLYESDI
ncbi:unnamed protein product, partial [Nippostrongylus brasiliensis]|uniref:DBD_Tnp_Mut domain-containing protein n=1 Tax=Nippostrongylus brasiliensis TaxID=27835 RepID=A0A0N4YVF5_NIPBR